jgi:hypothetical protein
VLAGHRESGLQSGANLGNVIHYRHPLS